ncbi:MAG: hypothetical protein ACRDX8_00770 [Acidimicrobiales bacterium]
MRASARLAVAAINEVLAAIMAVLGTIGALGYSLLEWVWIALGFVFTGLAFVWARAARPGSGR